MEECCDICGSVGVPDALVTCSQCKTSLQHMYCMRARFLEYPDDWCCEECEPSSKPTFSQLANCSEVRKGAAQPSKIRKLLNESKRGPFNCEKKVATRKTEFISINDVIKLPSGAIDSLSRSKVTCQSSTSQPPTREGKSCFSLKNSAFDVRWTSSPVHSRSTSCVSPTQDMADPQENFEDSVEDVDPNDPRELIYVVVEKLQPNSHKISAFITSQIKLSICPEGHCWKNVTDAQRQWYWDQFVATYKWSPLFESRVKKAWSSTIATLYRKTLHGWRASDRKPKCLAAEVWKAWKAVWGSDAWLKRSRIYKGNRHSELAGPGTGMTKHTAGSRSFVDHTRSMRAELGREPNSYELFYKTHTNKADEFVDERSRSVNTYFQTQRQLLSSASSVGTSHSVDLTAPEINRLYLNVVGGVHKGGKIYGLGTQTSGIYPEATAQCGNHSGGRGTPAASQAEIDSSREELRMYRDENAQLRDRIGSLEETFRKLVDSLEPRGNKKSAPSIGPSRMLHSSSRGRALVEKFTHVSGTYEDDDDDDDGDEHMLYDPDDDETQAP